MPDFTPNLPSAPDWAKDMVFGTDPSTDVQQHGLFTGEQQKLFQSLVQSMQGMQGPGQLSLAGLDEYTRNLATAGLSGADEEFLSSSIDQPAMRAMQEAMQGQRRSRAGSGGFYSTEAIRGEERLIDEMGRTITGGRAQFASQREGQREQLLSQLFLGKGNLELQDLSRQGSQQMAPYQLLAQILGIPQMENIAFQTPGQEGLLQGLSGAAGVAGGTYAGLKLAAL